MRLRILHRTTYRYGGPVGFGLQQLRMTPKSRMGQSVLTWRTEITGGVQELDYEDQHANRVILASFASEAGQSQAQGLMPQQQQQQQQSLGEGHVFTVTASGEVETADTSGVVGKHAGFAPLWYFDRATALTQAGPKVRALTKGITEAAGDDLGRSHLLAERVAEALSFESGETQTSTSAEEALGRGKGVCQDYAHVFIAAARAIGLPARYVSGYLHMPDRIDQEASHGWAEVHLNPLGWVGFDPANEVCPDDRYVRVATGLDYAEAAPVTGLRDPDVDEALSVEIQVEPLL